MLLMAVDDEQLMLKRLVSCIKEAEPESEVVCFSKSTDALDYANHNVVDVAFLDIKMRYMSGIELGKKLKLINPKINIIFCTGYDDYIYEAFHNVRATGYLFKPIKTEAIVEEMKQLTVPLEREKTVKTRESIFARCFGHFELFVEGQAVNFTNTKTKELLAYLVDRKGAIVSNRQIEAELWEDDKDHIKYLFKIKSELKKVCKDLGIAEIIKENFGGRGIGINMETLTCDYYQWLEDDPEGVRAYKGEYMEQYSGWAENTRAIVFQKTRLEG